MVRLLRSEGRGSMMPAPYFGLPYSNLGHVIFSYIVGHVEIGVEEIRNTHIEFPSEDGELPCGV